MTIDSHQHFWHYHPQKHSWINDEMAVIRKDFLPADLLPVLAANGVDACVAVQADETETETNFLIDLAADNAFIKAVVGWVDLLSPNINERLSHFNQYKIVKGFRAILQGREPAYMLQPSFINGIAALKSFGFTYDILIFPQHLDAAIALVKQFPDQPFVIDHIAKPFIKAGLIEAWKKGMETLAAFDNVYCKLSGMVTEADYKNWQPADFTPYLDAVVNAFGTKRLMFGSDWPVCLVASSYSNMIAIVKNYFQSFSADESAGIFGNNAARFYNIGL